MSDIQAKPRRGYFILAVTTLIAFVILCGLGVWQLQRLAWKTELIETVEIRTVEPAIAAPGPNEWPALDLDELDYRPVTLSGTFRNADEAHVFDSLTEAKGPLSGPGYFILTPFQTTEGWWVIVNRGFVPEEFKEPGTRPGGQIEGPTTITGLLRQPQGRNTFTPADNIAENQWFTRDPGPIGDARGLDPATLAPYYVDAAFDPSPPNGMPQGGETAVTFSNNHLQYVVTWFGLAAALVVIFIVMVRARRKQNRQGGVGQA